MAVEILKADYKHSDLISDVSSYICYLAAYADHNNEVDKERTLFISFEKKYSSIFYKLNNSANYQIDLSSRSFDAMQDTSQFVSEFEQMIHSARYYNPGYKIKHGILFRTNVRHHFYLKTIAADFIFSYDRNEWIDETITINGEAFSTLLVLNSEMTLESCLMDHVEYFFCEETINIIDFYEPTFEFSNLRYLFNFLLNVIYNISICQEYIINSSPQLELWNDLVDDTDLYPYIFIYNKSVYKHPIFKKMCLMVDDYIHKMDYADSASDDALIDKIDNEIAIIDKVLFSSFINATKRFCIL